jgi:hypothetical protein
MPSRLQGIIGHIRNNWIAVLLFLACSVWVIHPVIPHLDQTILGWQGDNVQYVYMIGWVSKAIFSFQSPFIDPHLNYPDGLQLAATDAPFGLMIAAAPVTQLLGPIFSYNLLILLNFFFSGYITYLWIYKLTKSIPAGIIAGLIFIFIPYRITHSYGHLNLISTAVIPLFFWTFDPVLNTDPPVFSGLVKLAVVTFLVGFCASQYYLLICLVFGFIYILLARRSFQFNFRHGWKLSAAMVSGALLAAVPYLLARGDALERSYDILQTRVWSASLTDFIVPSRLHLIWGSWIPASFRPITWIEHTLYLGVVACLLAVIAVFFDRGNRPRIFVWLSLILISLVLALGTDLHLHNGRPLQSQPSIWLPAYFLGQLPGFNLMRVWARFSIVAMFFISLLGGLGAKAIADRFTHHQKFIFFLLAAAIIIDFMPGRLVTTNLELRPIDRWLANQNGEFAVAFLPPFQENYPSMYGSLFHNKYLPAFNHPNHFQSAYKSFISNAAQFPQLSSLNALKGDHYRYLIVYPAAFDGIRKPKWEEIQNQLSSSLLVKEIAVIDGTIVYEFTSPE